MTWSSKTMVGAVVVTGALALAGCGQVAEKVGEEAAEKAIEQGSGGDVQLDLEDDSIKIEGEDGSLSIGGGEMPEDFPSEVTLPPGGTVVAGSSFQDGKNTGWLVESTYADSPSTLSDSLATGLESGGFDETGSFSTNGTTTATYEGNGFDVATAVTAADSGSALTITVTETTS